MTDLTLEQYVKVLMEGKLKVLDEFYFKEVFPGVFVLDTRIYISLILEEIEAQRSVEELEAVIRAKIKLSIANNCVNKT